MKFNNKNVSIGKNVILGKNVRIGDNTVLYDNVTIGDNVTICNDCVIGEPLNDYYTNSEYENPPTVIGNGSLIRSHSIFYAGSTFGDNLQTGHHVTVREHTVAGVNCQFGSYNDIQGYCTIGNYNKYHSYVNIGQKSKIGNCVFLFPFVILTNDPLPPSNDLLGVEIDDYSLIATASVLLPGAKIGTNSLVGANSTVGGVYSSDSFISGSPAKQIGKLSKMPFCNEQGKRYYPWQANFKRGMPWSDTDFQTWLELNKK